MATRAKWDCYQAAVDVLKGINGSPFNLNVEGRVYGRLFLPSERPDFDLPYVCLPIDQDGERIEYEGFLATSSFRLFGYAFFEDNPEDVLDCDGARQAAEFRDDVIRAFMADQTLGGTVQNCEVTSIETTSGVVDDGIAEVVFTLEFTQQAGAGDLTA